MLWIVIFFLLCYAVFSLAIGHYTRKKLKQLELQFIVGALHFHQLKYQMHEMLQIVYDKAGESDPQFIQDYKTIKNTLDRKINEMGDAWIKNLEKTVGYKLNFNSWEELIKKAEPFLREFQKNEPRKRD